MKEMIYEVCPHCSMEVSVLWDATIQGYLTKCPVCDSCLLLCRESHFLPESQGQNSGTGLMSTIQEVWHIYCMDYEKNKQRESLDENGKVWLDAVPSFWKGKQYEICRENI